MPGMGGKDANVKYKPSVPMKHLNWNKIPDRKLKKTVWQNLDYKNVELDVSSIESLFCSRRKKKVEEEKKKHDAPKEEVIRILDLKRANNVGIMLYGMKTSGSNVKQAILDMDDSILTLDKIVQLIRNAPSREEEEELKALVKKGLAGQLGKAEQFFVELVSIPRLTNRLEMMKFKAESEEKLADLRHNIEAVSLAVREVMSSTTFPKLLEIILAIGNFMNHRAFYSAAHAFKLEFLSKIGDTKSQDNKTTMIHYLAEFVSSKHPDLLPFADNFDHVEAASKLKPKAFVAEVKELKNALEQLKREISHAKGGKKQQDRFKEVMKPFQELMKAEIAAVQTEVNQMQALSKSLLNTFAESSDLPIGSFLD